MVIERAESIARSEVVRPDHRSPQPNHSSAQAVDQILVGSQERPAEDQQDAMIGAVQRANARAQSVRVDAITELQTRQLAEWSEKYLSNMASQRSRKAHNASLAQAKRKAAYWVIDQGFSDANLRLIGDHGHPFSAFGGQKLLDLFCGSPQSRGRKRSASVIEDGSDEDGRRFRSSPPVDQDAVGQDTV